MRRSVRSGFTLIELLVVISIIALLVSVLLPALSKARGATRTAQCLSNLHQYYLCYANYLGDSKGWFWWTTQPTWLKKQRYMPNHPYGDSSTYWMSRWAQGIHVCPSQAQSYPAGENNRWGEDFTTRPLTAWEGSHYGANIYLVESKVSNEGMYYGVNDLMGGYYTLQQHSQVELVRRPSTYIYVADRATDNAGGNSIRVFVRRASTFFTTTSFGLNHANAANVSYLDGHALTTPKTTIDTVLNGPNYPIYWEGQ